MRRIGTAWINLVFLIPLIVLSVLVWKDYSNQISNARSTLPEVVQLYYLDGGKKILSVTNNGFDGLKGKLYDKDSQRELKEITFRSNIHNQIAASYQKGRLAIATFDDNTGLQLQMINGAGDTEELGEGQLQFSGFLDSHVFPWRGQLIIAGENPDSAPYLAQLKDGKLSIHDLNKEGLFPSRPIRIDKAMGNFLSDYPLPLFQVNLQDQRDGYVSAIPDAGGRLLAAVQGKDESTFDTEERAGLEFAKKLGFNPAKMIKVDSEYPIQARYYNALTSEWSGVVKTPSPIYQAHLYSLNEDEILIAGSTTKDEAEGKTAGYIYNETTNQFISVTPIVGQLPFEELNSDDLQFYKEAGTNLFYYSGKSTSAGWMDLQTRSIQTQTVEGVKQWQLEEGGDQISFKTFVSYVKRGGPLVLNWAIWIFIPVILFGLIVILPKMLVSANRRRLEKGVIVEGYISDLAETGTYVNEQPLVRFTVTFEDQGQMKEVAIKKVISLLYPIRPGDRVMISYNRKKHKAVFVTPEDLNQVNVQPEEQRIEGAILAGMDRCGAVNRGEALRLRFTSGSRTYAVPVVQPPSFEYRVGETADLLEIGGIIRLVKYAGRDMAPPGGQLTLEGEVIGVRPMDIVIEGRRLTLFDMLVTYGTERMPKEASQFVPEYQKVPVGTVLPVIAKKEELLKELRLLKGKQGSGKVVRVEYNGTLGERPLARITVERGDAEYKIEQAIEPVYGVQEDDEVWIAYDEHTREAIIVRYSQT